MKVLPRSRSSRLPEDVLHSASRVVDRAQETVADLVDEIGPGPSRRHRRRQVRMSVGAALVAVALVALVAVAVARRGSAEEDVFTSESDRTDDDRSRHQGNSAERREKVAG